MYDFRLKCLYQNLYAIFFNRGTELIKNSLLFPKSGVVTNPRTIEQINTGLGFIILMLIVVSKFTRINYNNMYKFLGSRSSLMIKDKTRLTLGAFCESKILEIGRMKPMLECLCVDTVKILEMFKVPMKKLLEIITNNDLHCFLEELKPQIFKQEFLKPASMDKKVRSLSWVKEKEDASTEAKEDTSTITIN